jgi:AraC family transcriptional regulator, melibiose operon regulatory protein
LFFSGFSGIISFIDRAVGEPVQFDVFEDHRLCAGRQLDVGVMAQPHAHSQIELNLVTEGYMDYRFGGDPPRRIEAARLIMFWGAKPHQVVAKAHVTRFVCLYVPMSTILTIGLSPALRATLFAGGLIEAQRLFGGDTETFLRWRNDLASGDPRLETVVRDEVSARLRRIDLDGWRDLRAAHEPRMVGAVGQAGGVKVEEMARFIDEHASEAIDVERVAKAVGLHPNYAMSLFKKSLGITINQYLTRHRLDAAQTRLASSEADIVTVAFDSGFGSVSRFYEAFKARFAVSPAEFRRRQRRVAA